MPEKKKMPRPQKRALMLRLCGYFGQHKLLVFSAIALTLGSNLLALVGPTLSGKAIDAIQPGKGAVIFSEVFRYCGLMVLFYAGSSILSYILSSLMIFLSQKIVYQMRREIFNKDRKSVV